MLWTLDDLQFHYGDAYAIAEAHGRFTATRADGLGGPIEAPTPTALAGLLREDYRLRPVPREAIPPRPANPVRLVAD